MSTVGESPQGDSARVETLLSEIEKMRQQIAELGRQNVVLGKEQGIIDKQSGEVSGAGTDSVSGDNVSEVINLEKHKSHQRMGITEVSLLIPKFDPAEKGTLAAVDWVRNVENLKAVYGWDDRATMLYAVFRLEGAARYWYQCTQSTITSWGEFQDEIVGAFPSEKDETSILFQIMTRRRRKEECVENYFYNVAALAQQINMKEESTIKYIISGLEDKNLINMLLAANCKTLTELLVQIKRYEEIESHGKQRKILSLGEGNGSNSSNTRLKWSRPNLYRSNYRQIPYTDSRSKQDEANKARRLEESQKLKSISVRCFNCGEQGHFSSTCKGAPKNRICYTCRQPGHQAKECPSKKCRT